MKKCEKCVLERLDRKSRQQPSVKSLRGIICQKVMGISNFRKIKKLQKVTFAFLHTCTRYLPVLGGPNRKSATFHTFRTLALPNRPSRTFAYVYDVFARSGSPKTTFLTLGPDFEKSRSPGRRTLNRGGPPRGGAGGFLPSLSPLGLSSL